MEISFLRPALEVNVWQPSRLVWDAVNSWHVSRWGIEFACTRRTDLRAEEEKRNTEKETQRASVRKRQAENDQPYRQTVGRLILPGVHTPTPSIRRLRGMRSIPSWVINNIWRLVFPRGASRYCDGGGARNGKSLGLRGNGRSLHFCITRTNESTQRCAERQGHRWKYPIYMQIPYLSPRETSVASRQPRPFSSERNGEGASTQMDTRVDEK